MQTLWQDVRFGLRMLVRDPGFTVVAVLTLGLGIGANLALFGILNEMLLRPKPVARPHELWAIRAADAAGRPVGANLCRPYYSAIRRESRVFQGVIGYAGIMPKLRMQDGAERIGAELVSGEYFSFLGVVPTLGRGFLPEEDARTGAHTVAVISHAFWQSHFGGTPDVLGKTITLNDTQVEIVGVAPRGFTGLSFWPANLWLPASMEPMLGELTIYGLVGRLAEPRQAAAAADMLTPIAAEVTKELSGFKDPRWSRYGVSPDFHRIRLDPIGRGLLGTWYLKPKMVGFLKLAGVATVLLLVIACANVAGLFLARALQRGREMATRVALGATRGVLVRQLVCEGVLVAICGTAGALLVFSWTGPAILRFASWWSGPALRPVLDVRVLLFAAAGALMVGVGFSLLPALQAAGFQPFAAIKDGGGSGQKRSWLRHGLIVAQVVGSLVLLCGATLCLRSMSKQLAVDLGYRSDRLAVARLDLERIGFTADNALPQLEEIIRRVALVLGVERVSFSPVQPLNGQMAIMGAETGVEGYESPDGNPVEVGIYPRVGPSTFGVLGIPLLRGRDFSREDIESGRRVVIVNESFARRFWPGQEPLGKHVRQWEVVGVVQDACLERFDEQRRANVFLSTKKDALLQPNLLIRTEGDARHVVASVRAELARIHPRLLAGDVRTLRDVIKNALAVEHAALRILGALGILALVLAAVGTYGVMAYTVNSRTRELGIRLAVGATRWDVTRLILYTGLRLGLLATAVGLPLALGGAIVLRHQIAGISPFDPLAFIVVTACVLVALAVACWFPARRAARIDPMVALRCE
ncbi:MAG: ABC transporter permease [Sedimentisphaerales bacterium]|nr:ABC transporter permease [Sedimentisphaerales bacterium]